MILCASVMRPSMTGINRVHLHHNHNVARAFERNYRRSLITWLDSSTIEPRLAGHLSTSRKHRSDTVRVECKWAIRFVPKFRQPSPAFIHDAFPTTSSNRAADCKSRQPLSLRRFSKSIHTQARHGRLILSLVGSVSIETWGIPPRGITEAVETLRIYRSPTAKERTVARSLSTFSLMKTHQVLSAASDVSESGHRVVGNSSENAPCGKCYEAGRSLFRSFLASDAIHIEPPDSPGIGRIIAMNCCHAEKCLGAVINRGRFRVEAVQN